MEHVVDGGQADILVGTAVAGYEMGIEKLVVICPVLWDIAANFRVAVLDTIRNRVMSDIG
jgi:hypothetical protein